MGPGALPIPCLSLPVPCLSLPGPSGRPVTSAILAPAVPWRKFQDELANSDFICLFNIFSCVMDSTTFWV